MTAGYLKLRSLAEARLHSANIATSLPKDLQRLVHELQVYQVELEMQNEDLRQSQTELEETRARYVELYDFAPVGYLSLNENGVVSEANLCAAAMLGVTRSVLVNQTLSSFIHPDDQGLCSNQRRRIIETGELQEWEMRMAAANGPAFWAHLHGEATGDGGCRVTLSDITQLRRHRDHLDALVAERTAELEVRNAQLVAEVCERKRAEEDRKSYAGRLIALEEDLRKRVSLELHDDIGQVLTALGLNLAFIGNNMPDGTENRLRSTLADSRLLTKEISRSVRNLMVELRPSHLDEYGLASAVRSYADQFSQRAGIDGIMEVAPHFPRLSPKNETTLFRITLEALNNVVKHAAATKVSVSLQGDAASICLRIADDGKGFVPGGASPQPAGSGWGLAIMRERAELAGGSLQLTSAPGEGTSIVIEIRVVP